MKNLMLLFLLLSFFVPKAEANHQVYALTFQGSDTGYAIIDNSAWNDLCLLDSILRTETENVDTVISLWGWGYQHYPPFPKYNIPFVDGRASVAKLDTVTACLASIMDTTDILFVWLDGHGYWEYWNGEWHSKIDACPGDPLLVDTMLANFLNRLPCQARFIGFNSCRTFGRGNHPDSCGFATYLAIKPLPNNLHRKTVLFSAAGPQPKWSPGLCDNRPYQGQEPIFGLENEFYNNDLYFHMEACFHITTALNGGAEPSEYYSDSAPGFFFDSLDIGYGNNDGRISLGEAFRWDRRRHSQLGFEDNQLVDSGGLRNRFIIWPRIEIIDSLDASPIAFLPDTAGLSDSVIPVVEVKNYGLARENIPVYLQIGGNYAQTRTKNILPNHQDTIWFPAWLPNETGWIMVSCSTKLTNDEKPENDLYLDSIFILPTGLAEQKLMIQPERIPGIMTTAQFKVLANKTNIILYDYAGRRLLKTEGIRTGIYFIRTNTAYRKVLIIS
jgi:hypothetical protein